MYENLVNDIYKPFSAENIWKHLNTSRTRPGSNEILNTISNLKSMNDFPLIIEYPNWYPKILPTKINMSRDSDNVYILLANDSIEKNFVVSPDLGGINDMTIINWKITLKWFLGFKKTREPEKMTELLFKLLDWETDNLLWVSVKELDPKILKKPN